MEATIPLDKMSAEEKIRAMEILWEDLCKKAESIPSPEWHKNLLEQREKDVQSGRDRFVEWEKARKDILKSIS